MKRRIHLHIFIPVLALMCFLGAATWLIFSITAQWYTRYTAEKGLYSLMQVIENQAVQINELNIVSEGGSREAERQSSKELLSKVKGTLKSGGQDAKLMVFNSRLKQVYPQEKTDQQVNRGLYQMCVEMLDSGDLSAGTPKEVTAGGQDYLIQVFEVPAFHNVRAKYFVGFIVIPDMGIFLSYAGRLMAVIAPACFFAGGAAVWMVARSIARPLESMCRQTDQIGNGGYAAIDEQFALLELERLKNSFNQMQDRLRQAQEQNSRFFQNISHDLRTPLVAITGYAQGIQKGVVKDTKKASGIILAESLRMTNLVEGILAISKMENQELRLNLVSLDLEEFMEAQFEMLQGLSEQKELVLAGSDVDAYGMADPELTARMIQNVVSNCIRYAENRVEAFILTEKEWSVVVVEDDGPGFSEKDFSHLFERFYHGEKGNFGIGLSIVLSGMKYMGGRVEIENKAPPLHGAVYKLYFLRNFSE